MKIYWPAKNFITISVTGGECQLMCRHCQGRFLRHMEKVVTPDELWKLAVEKQPAGMLVSGGSDRHGAVPVLPYLDIINKIKKELNISMNLHTGLIAIEEIPKLAGKGIDVISFDVVGSPEALKNVYGLDIEPDYFDRAFSAFKDNGLKVVPHITVGLYRGKDSGEEKALRLLAKHEPAFVVINALMLSEGEELAAKRLPDILKLARDILPEKTAIGLGCMRPRGNYLSIEELACLDSIVLPTYDMLEELLSLGYVIIEKDGCCAFYG